MAAPRLGRGRQPSSIDATEPRLDVVIDNAGAIFPERDDESRRLRGDARHDGPRARSRSSPGCCRSCDGPAGARVIAVTSGGMYAQPLHLDDLQWARRPFDGTRAYAHAKRAQVALMREWARRIPAARCRSRDAPGLGRHARASPPRCPASTRLMGPLLRTPAEGADTTVWLAADPVAAGSP